MSEPRWSLIAQVFLSHPSAGYDKNEIVKLTHLLPSYISKYLAVWKSLGILRHEGYGRRYFLADETAMYKLISHSVEITGRRDTPSTPPSTMPPFHKKRVHKNIKFPKEMVDQLTIMGVNNPRSPIISISGPNDRAEQITHRGKTFIAVISRRSYLGTVHVESEDGLKEELKTWYGESVESQLADNDIVQDWEYGINAIIRKLAEKGIKVKVELPGSQTGIDAIEGQGITEKDMRVIKATIARESFMEAGVIAQMLSQQDALRHDNEDIKATVLLAATAITNQNRIISDLQGTIKTLIGNGNGTGQPYKAPEMPEPPRGMFG